MTGAARRIWGAVVLFSGLSLGCASFPTQNFPPLDSVPEMSLDRPSAKIEFTYQQFMNGERVTLFSGLAESSMRKRCIGRLERSGLFKTVGTDVHEPDLVVNLLVKNDGEANMGLAFLTGYTLYLIPSNATDRFSINVLITDTRTGHETPLHMEETITTWQQIFLLPIMPFKFSPIVALGVQRNLFDHLAKGIHAAIPVDYSSSADDRARARADQEVPGHQ